MRFSAFEVRDGIVDAVAHHGVATEPIRVDEHTARRFTFFRRPGRSAAGIVRVMTADQDGATDGVLVVRLFIIPMPISVREPARRTCRYVKIY